MKKRIIPILLAVCMLFAALPFEASAAAYGGSPLAAKTDVSRYFYGQLGARSKVFYNALVKMLQNGDLKTGTASVELTGEIGAEAVAGHMNGSIDLLSEFGAARDAFYMDYPDVFYVDFSDVSIRITQSGSEYHLYMGPGRYPTYYADGFENAAQVEAAISEYNAALQKVLAEAAGKSSDREKVKAVHDYLTKTTTYRDEVALYEMYTATGSTLFADAAGSIRTAYGCLVRHMGVCESYTRAFKAAMDKLGIPCVMIYGVYQHSSESAEQHIWNAVEIEGEWYGVDVTMDDPISSRSQKDPTHLIGLDGYENDEYLLCGAPVMAIHHIADGIMSESGYEFEYPMMNVSSYAETLSDENSPLKVRYKTQEVEGVEDAGVYYVSYFGMNGTEMKDQGYYLIMRNKVYDVIEGWILTDWYYYMPEIYDVEFDVGHESKFDMPHVEYVEFGVTDIPCPKIVPGVIPDQWFHGDDSLLLARSGILHNQNGTYRAAPQVKTITPAMTMRMDIDGKTHHVVANYDDILVLPEVYDQYCATEKYSDPAYLTEIQRVNENNVKMKVTMTDRGVGSQSGVRPYDYSDLVKNLKITHHIESGSQAYTTVEFDFKPSEMWADDMVCYDFYLEGAVGAWSGKKPNSITYGCAHPCAICCYRRQGFDYNCFAKPQLLSDSDLSLGDVDNVISNAEGTPFEEQLKSRLLLVVSDANRKDAHTMEEMIEKGSADSSPAEVLAAESYNINLTLCKMQLDGLGNGMSVRITCGFPYGYGPDDAGVTFKAYHYIKDDLGNITGIEEIPCTITPYGLLIECRSFSPFTIAAVKADPNEIKDTKTLVLVSDIGGSVIADGTALKTVTLKKGGAPVEVTVSADSGYEVDSVEISGANIESSNSNGTRVIKIGYDDVTDENSAIISAKFVPLTVAAAEIGNAVLPVAQKPVFDISAADGSSYIACAEGGEASLNVKNPSEAYTYKWYKKGENGAADAFAGSGAAIKLENLSASDSGSYYCTATATAGGSVEIGQSSNTVTVNVGGAGHTSHSYSGPYVPFGEDGHVQSCECGAYSPIAPHTFNADGTCTACGYTNQLRHTHRYDNASWDISQDGHAAVCTFIYNDGKPCGSVSPARLPHSFDASGRCMVCGYQTTVQTLPQQPAAHVHSFVTAFDMTGHFGLCTVCGQVAQKQNHTFGYNGICTVCGYCEPAMNVPDVDEDAPPREVEVPQEGKIQVDVGEDVG